MAMSTTERNALRRKGAEIEARIEAINLRIDTPGADNFALESEKEQLEYQLDQLINKLRSS